MQEQSQSTVSRAQALLEETYYTLRAREKALAEQLDDVQDRRDNLAQELVEKSGADRAGVESRLSILDQRLIALENDLTAVGREIAASAPAKLTVPEPRTHYLGYSEDDLFVAGFSGAGLAFALMLPFLIRTFRRRKYVAPMAASPAGFGGERIDRMEQAIDSIAVEIERVSENQRFMTRLMTETQLAGSIAAVRGSTEVARAAAEPVQNV